MSVFAGTVSTGSIDISEKSGILSEFIDVILTSETHNNTIAYDTTNWINTELSIQDLSDISISSSTHDEVLVWNSVSGSWENGKVSDLLTELEGVVTGIITVKLSVFVGESGDPAKSLNVAFTDELESGFTMSLTSCGDNNAIYKKGPSESGFTFLKSLNKGEIYNTDLEAGTVFRSDKGMSGFSAPFPMPFGISCLADTYFRFYALRNDNVIHVTSAGRASLITLFASDETTVVDGPTLISAFGSTTLACDSNSEFVVVATTEVFCGTKGDRGIADGSANKFIDMRIVPPMETEIIVHNRNNRLSAQKLNTNVTWYRRNMETGTIVVQSGTPFSTTGVAGNDTDYDNDGWLILRADGPITGFSGADTNGYESTPAMPLTKLAQFFPILAEIGGGSTDFGRSSVSLAGPYEGTATVYDESGTILDTFTLTRGTSPPVTVNDQLFPAAGQWNPETSISEDVTSGYVEVNVPCVCIQNLNGSAVFTLDSGDEIHVAGSTPDELRAFIRKDSDGFLRRRDISTVDGSEIWVVC